MGVEKKILKEGNGTERPQRGDEVTIEYTGNLYDEAQADNDYRGDQYDVPPCLLTEQLYLTTATGSTHPSGGATLRLKLGWAKSSEVEDTAHSNRIATDDHRVG